MQRRLLLSSHSRSQKRSGNSYFEDAGSYDEIVHVAGRGNPKNNQNLSKTQKFSGFKNVDQNDKSDFSRTQKLNLNRLDVPQSFALSLVNNR